MTAREIRDCLVKIDNYLKKTVPADVPILLRNWSEALAEAVEIIEGSKYWPDK